MKKRSSQRRREFLIDSNTSPKKRPKRVRNTFLNTLAKVVALKSLVSIFEWKNIARFIITLMIVFLVFALLSPYYKLKQISILRNNPSIDVELIQSHLEEFYGNNVLFLSKDAIKDKLKTVFPEFKALEIKEKWPDGIQIEIEMSPGIFTLLNKHSAKFFTLLEEGIVLPKQESADLPVITLLQYDRPIEIRSQILKPKEVVFINYVRNFLSQEFKLEAKEIRYLWAAQEVHAIVHDNTEIWFDVNIDVEDQLNRLALGMDEINLYSRPPQHIDLRIPSQLYWSPPQ